MDPAATRTVPRPVHGSSQDDSLLDFSANTNPRTPDGTDTVYEQAFEADRRGQYRAFCGATAEYVGCDPDAVVPTRGGMMAIRRAIALTVTPGDSVLVPAPSFSEYAREVRLQGGTPEFVPADEMTEADPARHTLAIVCHPNNPTGHLFERRELRSFAGRCRAQETVLLADEAFLDFTEQPSLAGTAGVVVARSLTKMFGYPGLRAGCAIATGELGSQLQAVNRPDSPSTPALAVGTFCLNQSSFVTETRQRVRAQRARLREQLTAQFDVFPSTAPFLLFDAGETDVDALLADAREQGVALRDARTFRGLDNHVRVAVRLPEENTRLLEVLSTGDV